MSMGKNFRATYLEGEKYETGENITLTKDDLLKVVPIIPLVARLIHILELKIPLGIVLRFKFLISKVNQ